ncbi:hypothetical protein HZ326_15207 [Fusarium oxysporum f. sp. albedinis]|nr:hypothetical protein HZ326_15207 [Fusarium oxysporum f. sp. albedinis]
MPPRPPIPHSPEIDVSVKRQSLLIDLCLSSIYLSSGDPRDSCWVVAGFKTTCFNMSLRDEEDQGRECRLHISYLALIFRKNLECFCRVAVVNVEHISLSATNGYRLSSSRLTELSRYWSLVVASRFGPESYLTGRDK